MEVVPCPAGEPHAVLVAARPLDAKVATATRAFNFGWRLSVVYWRPNMRVSHPRSQ